MLFLRIVPVPSISHLSTGFRLAPRPPMAHMPVLATIHVLHPCLTLKLLPCRFLPVSLIPFEGSRCRPHLRV
jgi:hypothetical protein